MAELDPIQHLRNLDYPRRSGTDGERKAAAYIAQVLADIGTDPMGQEFYYAKPKILPRLILPLALSIWILLSLANVQFLGNNLIISLVYLALPLALIVAVIFLNRVMRYFFARNRMKLSQVEGKIMAGKMDLDQVIKSQNVIAEIGPADAAVEVLFTAHFDSISTKIPMRVMTTSGIVGFIGLLLYSVIYLGNLLGGYFLGINFIETYFPYFALLATIVLASLLVSILARFFRGNDSHGIIDDGTGVAILLELARFVQNHHIPGYKFTFGFFGSEESGLIGSANYYLNRDIDNSKLYVISIDMIGEKPPLSYVKGIYPIIKRNMDPRFNEQMEAITQSFDIEIKGKSFPYPGSDFGHFLLDGECRTNWLINGSNLIHSKNDNLSNLNEALVNDALKLLVAYLLPVEETKVKQ